MCLKPDEQLDDLQVGGLTIIQKKNGFRFGMDAVLLSDFAKSHPAKCTLDLCTGTGIVPLLLSAKTTIPTLCGLELQQDIADMASRCVSLNHLSDRIHIQCGDLRRAESFYGVRCFDSITCNPPYIPVGSGLRNPSDTKTISRHELFCTLEDVISTSARLLTQTGRLFLVHRPNRLVDVLALMRSYRIEPKRVRFVHPTVQKEPSLVLVEGLLYGKAELRIAPPLFVYGEDGNYSDELNQIYERTSS
jgi:tRNA1Val (adenine37-N6)-methyltransferase